ncbi:MAG: metallophosphoesterase [Gemmatimonadota bacterium]
MKTRPALKLALAVTTAFTVALCLWAFWLEPASLTVAEQHLDIPWPGRRPLRIAVLTDLHVGSPFNGLGKLRAIVARTNAAKPDIICILGDLVIQGVIGGRFVPPEAIAKELAGLRAPAGVIAVLGNHDGWLGHDRVQHDLEQVGIRVVEDTAALVDTPGGPVWVAGVSDLWTGRHDVDAALATVPADGSPVLLLTHNPDIFPAVPDRVTLTLAGHTHGGQVRLPFVGALIVPSSPRYTAGLIVEGGRHLFVSTGLGTSRLPVRFRVPPAVTLLTVGDAPAVASHDGRPGRGAP